MGADVFNHAIGIISKFKWELFKANSTRLHWNVAINFHQYAFRLQILMFHIRIICGGQIFYFPIRSQIVELAFICLDFQATWKCLWSNNPGGYFLWKPLISMRPISLQCFFQAVWHLGGIHWGQPYADGDVDQFNTAPNAFKPHATSLLDPMTHEYYDDYTMIIRWLLMKMKK